MTRRRSSYRSLRSLQRDVRVCRACVEAGFPLFIDFYLDHICIGTRPYGGLEAVLDRLAARGIRLALCTNKAEVLTFALLEALGWQRRFDAVVGGDTLPVRKPDAAPLHEAIARAGGGRAAFVGDSITDADTARAAGLPFVAVSFGFSDRPVEALGADAVIDSYEELEAALARISSLPKSLRSSSRVLKPRMAASRSAPAPVAPPPITTTSV